MINSQSRQQVSDKKSEVVDVLDNLLEELSIGKGELAVKMGYDPASFSRIYNEKDVAPEKFLLIGRLLLENLQLRRKLTAIEGAQRTLNALAMNDVSSKLPPAAAMVVQPVKYVVPTPPKKRGGRKSRTDHP